MNKIIMTCLSVMLIGLVACGGGECTTCSGQDPFFGLEISSEACDNEDGTITVTSSVAGITQDTTFTGTISAFVTENQAAGLDCN